MPWLKIVVLVNPLVYMSEGMRVALTPVPHMSLWAIYGALVGFTDPARRLGNPRLQQARAVVGDDRDPPQPASRLPGSRFLAPWSDLMTDRTDGREGTGPGTEHLQHTDEARYRALVENLPAVIYQVAPDDDRRTMYVSPHVETALGYSRDEWLGQPDIWMELLHPDDREQTLAAHDLHNETGRPWSREYRLIANDGQVVWFRDVATLVRDDDGRPQHWLGVQLDITELKGVEDELRAARDELEHRVAERTAELEEANAMMALEIGERRRAEADLRTAEHRYRLLAEQIPAVTYIWEANRSDDTSAQYYTSPRVEQLLGYTIDEWHASADFWMSRLHPDDRHAVIAAYLRSESTGEAFAMEYRYLHKDGRIVWVADQAILMSREDGRPKLFQGVMIDVSSRKEAELAVAETELRYRDRGAGARRDLRGRPEPVGRRVPPPLRESAADDAVRVRAG